MIGYNYFSEFGIFWRYHFHAIIPLSPPHIKPDIKVHTAKDLLKRKKALLVRWEEGFDLEYETEWWHIIKDQKENIDSLSKKTRNQIRRGRKNYTCKVCDREVIINKGYDIYKGVFSKYQTFEKSISKVAFQKAIRNLPPQTEFWSVVENLTGLLVGFSENIILNNVCLYVSIWILPEHMKEYAGYTLFHEMNKYYLNEQGCKYVSDGARSISHQTNIHEFLQSKFGFRKAYCKLNIFYKYTLFIAIRTLYPFKKIFTTFDLQIFDQLDIILEQERIRRTFL